MPKIARAIAEGVCERAVICVDSPGPLGHRGAEGPTGLLRLNLASGPHPLEGFANLDLPDWRFEDGLGDYQDETVDGLSESHGLMFLPLRDWPALFAEIARVLKPGGVVRVTEDSTRDRRSPRYGGFVGAVTLTYPLLVIDHMEQAGLHAGQVRENETFYRDDSLIQNWHGRIPKIFHVEAVKPCSG